MNIEIVPGYDRVADIIALFSEYTEMLIAGDPKFSEYLDIQNYDHELKHPEVKYGMPWGRLYIALCDGAPAGCIALRRIDSGCCELKRLYVRPGFRGMHIGAMLSERLIEDARSIGYSRMRLDTLPSLRDAVKLYRRLGFTETDKYNDSPMDDSVFMELILGI